MNKDDLEKLLISGVPIRKDGDGDYVTILEKDSDFAHNVAVFFVLDDSGGSTISADKLNVEAFVQQAENYAEALEKSNYEKSLQGVYLLQQTHPFMTSRCLEVRKWHNEQKDNLPPSREHRNPGLVGFRLHAERSASGNGVF